MLQCTPFQPRLLRDERQVFRVEVKVGGRWRVGGRRWRVGGTRLRRGSWLRGWGAWGRRW